MCKINPTATPLRHSECSRALDSIAHRGPDDFGEWVDPTATVFMGHRRLSIIDLSRHSHQPMRRSDDVMIYNGEIYNFSDVKQELTALGYKFESTGDTEVLLYAYQHWGIDAVRRFKGMFAFIIWSERTKEIIAVRDQLGIKPLYYSLFSDGSFAASSEVKTFHAFTAFEPAINPDVLEEFFQYRSVDGKETLLKGVYQLLPGEYLRFSQATGAIETRKYWSAEDLLDDGRRIETDQHIHDLLNESVRQHLISDVPVGTQFSGGIDSSLVSAIAQKEFGAKLTGFYCKVADAEFDETPYAEKIAGVLGIPLEQIAITSNDFFSSMLDDMTWHMDEPINHPNSLGIYMVSKLAKGKVKVLLSGESADEFFAGYDWYKFMNYHRILNGLPKATTSMTNSAAGLHPRLTRIAYLNSWAHSTPAASAITESSRFISDSVVPKFLHVQKVRSGGSRRLEYVRSVLQKSDVITATQLYDVRTYLPPLFMRQDRMSMAASIENRVPIALPEILEAAMHMDSGSKISLFRQKKILKDQLLKYVPKHLVYRRKWGFAIPLKKWYATPIGRERLDQLVTEDFPTSGYFNLEYIRTIAGKQEKSAEDIQVLWTVMSYSLWARTFLGGGAQARLQKLHN